MFACFHRLQKEFTPVTATIALVTLVVHLIAEWSEKLQFDASLVAKGEIYRIWTGHLTHFDWSHLSWDLLMFVVLGIACERQFTQRYLPSLLMMMGVVSGAVAGFREDIAIYRGLSGVDTGLFAWLAIDAIREGVKDRDRFASALWTLPLFGLFAKLGYEWTTGEILFVDASNFIPLVESHLAGAFCGVALGLIPMRKIMENIVLPNRRPVLDAVPECPV